MNDLLTYVETLTTKPELKNSISDLVKLIEKEKKYKFDFSEKNINVALLQPENILINDEGNRFFEISNTALFFSEFFNHYSIKFSFTLTNNLSDAFEFVNKIEEELKTENVNSGVSAFYRRLKRFITFLIAKTFALDFEQHALSLNKETSGQDLYDFNSSYCKIFPYINSSIESIYRVLSHLVVQMTANVEFNGNLGSIRRSVLLFCKIDHRKANSLYEFAITQDPVVVDLISALTQGIYELKGKDFWREIEKLSKLTSHRISVICALRGIKPSDTKEAKLFYDLIDSFSDFNEHELINLPPFYTGLLSSDVVIEPTLKLSCVEKLKALIVNPNKRLRQIVLTQLSYIDNNSEEIYELLNALVESEGFEKEDIRSIDQVFIRERTLGGFILLVQKLGHKFPMEFTGDSFSSALHNFRSTQNESLHEELIKLCTNDKGAIRFIGNRIIESLTPHRGRFTFQTDILKLDAITQYKLWISRMEELKEPDASLPMLLPLLDSKFSYVQEAFIGKIEQLTEEYGSTVMDVLKSELDQSNPHYKNITDRVEQYCESFWKEIAKKRDIKEFNPLYTQSELYHKHSSNFGKSFNKSLKENVEKKSFFMQFATPVILAKGGGWKHEKHQKVEKLGQISSSFQLPRSYFLAPEEFDWDFRTRYFEDWENKFKSWEAIISS